MTVQQLITTLQNYLDNDKQGRYLNRLYITDGYNYECSSIDCVYYRNGEVVLQSNETDNGNWALIIPYIIHCLKFFNKNMDVCVQVSDEDLDYDYLEPIRTTIDDDDDIFLLCNSRSD